MTDLHPPRPLVNIGLPVYNAERYVAHSIESLLDQSFGDFLVLICDNASTDRTGEICRSYAQRDARVRYHLNDANIGMPGNFNLTFGMSRSRYFRWATADDYCDSNMLQDSVEIMENDPSLALCYPRAIFVDENGAELFRWQDELHLMEDDPASRFCTVVTKIEKVHHHLGLMRSEIVRRTGLWSRHVSTDMGFVAEMSLYGKFFQFDKYQFYRRQHQDSSSWATEDDHHQGRTYHESGVRLVPFNRIRFHRRYFQAVKHSPLGLRARWGLYRFLLRFAATERGRIWRELTKDIQTLMISRR